MRGLKVRGRNLNSILDFKESQQRRNSIPYMTSCQFTRTSSRDELVSLWGGSSPGSLGRIVVQAGSNKRMDYMGAPGSLQCHANERNTLLNVWVVLHIGCCCLQWPQTNQNLYLTCYIIYQQAADHMSHQDHGRCDELAYCYHTVGTSPLQGE